MRNRFFRAFRRLTIAGRGRTYSVTGASSLRLPNRVNRLTAAVNDKLYDVEDLGEEGDLLHGVADAAAATAATADIFSLAVEEITASSGAGGGT
jgi:hypothetical protein